MIVNLKEYEHRKMCCGCQNFFQTGVEIGKEMFCPDCASQCRCGNIFFNDEAYYCESCGEATCEDCYLGDELCNECGRTCPTCDAIYGSNDCFYSCGQCGETYCENCMDRRMTDQDGELFCNDCVPEKEETEAEETNEPVEKNNEPKVQDLPKK